MAEKKKIINRLKSLGDIKDVTVTVSDGEGSIDVDHKAYHALSFKFVWSVDHFIGYFVDGEGLKSQAVISLWTGMDAIRFASAFDILVDMRAKQVS